MSTADPIFYGIPLFASYGSKGDPTVRLSQVFCWFTAQTINEFVRMQKDINTVILMSAELRLMARVTSVFLM